MLLERAEIEAGAIHHDLRARNLTKAGVGLAEHPGFLDPRELVDAVLDFFRKEFQPGHEDDGLLPALEVEAARLVAPADIPGQEPAVAALLLATLPGCVIRREQSVAPDGNLSDPPRRQMLAFVGHDGDLVAGNGASHGGGR